MTYYAIKHQQIGGYRSRPHKYIFCTGLHKIEDYQSGVVRSQKEKEKIYVYVIPKYADCIEANAANFLCCTLKHKAEINTRKKRLRKVRKKKS